MLHAHKFHQKAEKASKNKKEALAAALLELQDGVKSYGEVSRRYKVPATTLYRHFNNPGLKTHGRQPIFNECFEKELAGHVKKFDDHFFGLTTQDVRKLAYQMAEENNIPHRFNHDKKMAGKDWLKGFFSRPPGAELAIRQAESLSFNRIISFTQENCDKFFDILISIVDTHGLNASRIYNMDESGFSTVQKKNIAIVSTKGKRRVSTKASGERGVNTTVVCCANAAGDWHVKPFVIFKGQRITQDHAIGLIEGGRINGSKSGYIDSELFLVWLEYFISVVRPTPEKKVLLVLDGHTSHTKSIEALTMAEKNGVIMLQLPAHTTHRLQPLDVAFFGPLSKAYDAEVRSWMRKNPANVVTTLQFSEIFSAAYKKTANHNNAANGFAGTGIWPIDKNIFLETDFAKTSVPAIQPSSLNLKVPLEQILPLPIIPRVEMQEASKAVELTSPIYISGLQEKLRVKAEKERQQKERIEIRAQRRKDVAESKAAKAIERAEVKERKKIERELQKTQKLAEKNRSKKKKKKGKMVGEMSQSCSPKSPSPPKSPLHLDPKSSPATATPRAFNKSNAISPPLVSSGLSIRKRSSSALEIDVKLCATPKTKRVKQLTAKKANLSAQTKPKKCKPTIFPSTSKSTAQLDTKTSAGTSTPITRSKSSVVVESPCLVSSGLVVLKRSASTLALDDNPNTTPKIKRSKRSSAKIRPKMMKNKESLSPSKIPAQLAAKTSVVTSKATIQANVIAASPSRVYSRLAIPKRSTSALSVDENPNVTTKTIRANSSLAKNRSKIMKNDESLFPPETQVQLVALAVTSPLKSRVNVVAVSPVFTPSDLVNHNCSNSALVIEPSPEKTKVSGITSVKLEPGDVSQSKRLIKKPKRFLQM